MELELRKGIGEIVFGMTKDEVIGILGIPDRERVNIDDDNDLILDWNSLKLSLTFYKDEGNRFGYIITKNPSTILDGEQIIGTPFETIKDGVLNEITEWEEEDYESFKVFFNKDNWISFHIEYGVIDEIEMGVPFNNDDEYHWPK